MSVMADSNVRWQCRRGMRELDELLQDYFEQRYASASDREKLAFRELLALPDPELIGYLLGGQEAADRVSAHVVQQIRNRTHTA